jgi:hypothetical protein
MPCAGSCGPARKAFANSQTNGSHRQLHEAHEQWVEALLLLPVHSKQADWIKGHLRELEHKIEVEQIPEPSKGNWAKKLGPVGPIAIVLAKSKGLLTAVFKLKFLLTFFAFIGVYWLSERHSGSALQC